MSNKITLLMIILIIPLWSQTQILVDGIHGWTALDQELDHVFPEYEFSYLGPDDVQLDMLIATGTIVDETDAVTFLVPEGQELLSIHCQFDTTLYQHPYITILDNNGQLVTNAFNGFAYVNDPTPGIWMMEYFSIVENVVTTYQIGTGPNFYTLEMLSNYDMVLQLVDDTFSLFYGAIPTHSFFEQAQLDAYLDSGGAYLILREPIGIIAFKPIIRLYADKQVQADIILDFPGIATYTQPEPEIQRAEGFSRWQWPQLQVDRSQYTEILYEGKLQHQLNYISLSDQGNSIRIENQVPQSLHDFHYIQALGNGSYRYAYLPEISGFGTGEMENSEIYRTADLIRHLESQLLLEVERSGFCPTDARDFIMDYQWIDRWLHQATQTGDPYLIYHFDRDLYDQLIPLSDSEDYQTAIRSMWVLAENPPAEVTGTPLLPEWSSVDDPYPQQGNAVDIDYYEFGVIVDRYPAQSFSNRDQTILEMNFYDDILVDETNNANNDLWQPIFTTFGDNPAAEQITLGISELQGQVASAVDLVDPEAGFLLVTGDEDSYCEDWMIYPPGTFPPVAVGRELENGKVIGISDLHFLLDVRDNHQFLRNCISWLTEVSGDLGDVNQDGSIDVLDVVVTVSFIIGSTEPTPYEFWAADFNGDAAINVLDVVLIVNVILGDPLPPECYLEPEVGPCDGICPRYFFNQNSEQCEMFEWGCCEGVVPFDTLEECEGTCE